MPFYERYKNPVVLFDRIAVSNALKPQRKTSITGLTPATQYVVRMEAYNIAGSSSGEFHFATLTKEGGTYILGIKNVMNKFKF